MSEPDTGATEAAATTPVVTETTLKTEPKHSATVDAVEAVKKPAVKRKASDDKATTPQIKRRTSSPRVTKIPKDSDTKLVEGEDTESEPEKHPKKRAKMIKKGTKTPGRRKKIPVESEEDIDDEQREVEKKIDALSDTIKGRFGQIVWAKMGGYPYWPCIITDPRLLPQKLQETALKALETKFVVFFYVSNNFAPVSFKMIESWDDAKFKYREGHPEKDSKAPKRRAKLMQAIDAADKETKLPIEERANGLLRPTKKVEESVEAAPVKRKPGRPPKNKTSLKSVVQKTPKKRQTKGDGAEEAAGGAEGKRAAPATARDEEEDPLESTLSKEEIKAKVASRKTPKKKGTDNSVNAVGASVKKMAKVVAKHGKSNGLTEIDNKRKKEIELVVPHKTVKSADIREMTEEAAKKKLGGPKSRTKKDKGEYKVGDLSSFASKMARLHAKESARNNDELVGMMQTLFKETLMYRSDVERSGLAAIIAMLRKSLSPTVGQTASALRKHMINILDTDIKTHMGKKAHEGAADQGTKKRKTESVSSLKSEEQQQSSTESSSSPAANIDGKENSVEFALPSATASSSNEAAKASRKEDVVEKNEEETLSKPVEDMATKAEPSNGLSVNDKNSAETNKTTSNRRSASPLKTEGVDGVAKDNDDIFETPEHVDKNRETFVDMLSKILDHGGAKRADLAKEIEAALFERFKESNDDYLSQARIIIFGLKGNASMRDRLFSGALHCLEFAYADDAFFSKATE